MNTCKDCDHWDTKTVGVRDEVEYDSYEDRHYCWLLSNKESEVKKINPTNDAEAAAHGIGGAKIATGPDFGCVHWSNK